MSCVYLIPSLLNEEGLKALPPYLADAIKTCQVFFVENERTTRRFFKKLLPAIVIDDHEWIVMDENAGKKFSESIKAGKTIGIVSEAGCPGVADPGQAMVAIAQEMEIEVKPLVGPSSILLALMASGMNGQQFRFNGYLPIDRQERMKILKELEADSLKNNCTEIFIETPYRNNQLGIYFFTKSFAIARVAFETLIRFFFRNFLFRLCLSHFSRFCTTDYGYHQRQTTNG